MAKTIQGSIGIFVADDNSTASNNASLNPSTVAYNIAVSSGIGYNLTVPAAGTVNIFASAPTGTVGFSGWVRWHASEAPADQFGTLLIDGVITLTTWFHFSSKPATALTWTNDGNYSAELYVIAGKV